MTTFGTEFEMMIPAEVMRAQGIQPGGYHMGRQVPGLPQGWNAQCDGSIRAESGYVGVEIVSPILRGTEGLLQIKEVLTKVREWGAKVNGSCGFHVHVGFASRTISDLRRLTHLVSNLEKAIYASTGTHNREQGCFCKSIKQGFRDARYTASFDRLGQNFRDRYHVLNVANLVNGSKPTVEFRAFAGTLNVTKAEAYVRMCVAFIEKATSSARAMTWDAVTPTDSSPIHRSGEGQIELTRFFYAMGWTQGHFDEVFGNLVAEGLTTIEQSKRMLMKMARKYDGVQNVETGEE